MPFLLYALTGMGLGAYIGSQIDDKLDAPVQIDRPIVSNISPLTVATYAAVGIGAWWLFRKVITK